MGRLMKYPELLELKIGESLFIPKTEVANLASLRASVSWVSKKYGITLSVHDDASADDIEIARHETNDRLLSGARIAPSVRRYQSLSEAVADIRRDGERKLAESE